MGNRFVWSRFRLKETYSEISDWNNGAPFLPAGVTEIYIAKSYTFSQATGKYTLVDPVHGGTTVLGAYDAGEYRYMSVDSATTAIIYSCSVNPGYDLHWSIASSGGGTYYARIYGVTASITRHYSSKSTSKGAAAGKVSGPSNAPFLQVSALAARAFSVLPGSSLAAW